MIIVDELIQGSDEWLNARLGIPTASCFDKVITATGKPSSQSDAYMHQLLAEWLTGEQMSFTTNQWIERGNELEPQARTAYEFMQDQEVTEVGLVYRDERKLIAVSPDGLCKQTNSGLEIKCPAPHTHVANLLTGEMPSKYKPQVQGNIWVCEADYWDFMSYHEQMEPLIVRIDRDEAYIKKMTELFDQFIDLMLERREILTQQRRAA